MDRVVEDDPADVWKGLAAGVAGTIVLVGLAAAAAFALGVLP